MDHLLHDRLPASSHSRTPSPGAASSPSSTSRDTLRVLAFGGCHVIGFPYDEQYSFVNVATAGLHDLGIPARSLTLPYVRLRDVARLQEVCCRSRPHVLVLQLGHYEPSTVPALREVILPSLTVRGSAKPSSSKLPSGAPQVLKSPDAHFTPDTLWRLRSMTKCLVAGVFKSRMVRMTALRCDLRRLLDAACALPVSHIFVLSPFPCADPVITDCRKRIASAFENECAGRAVNFIDVMSTLHEEFGILLPHNLFADTRHLSVLGQAKVGSLVASRIKAAVTNRTLSDAWSGQQE